MKIDGKYKFKDVSLQHFDGMGNEIGFREDYIRKQIINMTERIASEGIILSNALKNTKETQSPIFADIMDTIISHTKQLSC